MLAGHRVTLRLDGELAHVIDDGVLVRTLPAPGAPGAAPTPARRAPGQPTVARPGWARAGATAGVQPRCYQVARQRLDVGSAHRPTLVDIDVHETEFHVYDQAGELLGAIGRASGNEVTRAKGYGVRDRIG